MDWFTFALLMSSWAYWRCKGCVKLSYFIFSLVLQVIWESFFQFALPYVPLVCFSALLHRQFKKTLDRQLSLTANYCLQNWRNFSRKILYVDHSYFHIFFLKSVLGIVNLQFLSISIVNFNLQGLIYGSTKLLCFGKIWQVCISY